MIKLENNVADFLDRLYVRTAMNRKPQIDYSKCVNAIESLLSTHHTIIATEPFAWARDKATIVQSQRYWFRYSKIGNDYIIEQVYDTYTKQLVTEARTIKGIIAEVINRYIETETRKL